MYSTYYVYVHDRTGGRRRGRGGGLKIFRQITKRTTDSLRYIITYQVLVIVVTRVTTKYISPSVARNLAWSSRNIGENASHIVAWPQNLGHRRYIRIDD